MKTRVLILISASALALGILAFQAGAQITATNTSFSFKGPAQNTVGALSIVETNPAFQRSFQSKIGVQTATTTNGPFQLGTPSIVETNPLFGSSFQGKTSSQISTTTNAPLGIPSQNQLGAPSTTGTNPFFGRSFQSSIGAQIAPTTNPVSAPARSSVIGAQTSITNFLFSSSAQSWVGQGQGVFAAATNGYNVRLTQIAPQILQFSITSTNSVATNWLLEFSTTNDFFTAGIYSNTVNAGRGPTRLVFAGMGRGDNTSLAALSTSLKLRIRAIRSYPSPPTS
jgi:hypothetical protein